MNNAARDHEAGMSLVELLIYAMLLVAIIALGGGIMIGSISSQRTVSTLSSAATTGQLVSTSVEVGIRNASAFQVASPTTLGQLLRSRTLDISTAGVSTWQCRAWFRTAAGDFYVKYSNAIIPPPAAASDLATWTLLAGGVGIPAASSQAFTANANQLELSLSVEADDAQPVLIKTTILSRPQTDTGTVPTTCF